VQVLLPSNDEEVNPLTRRASELLRRNLNAFSQKIPFFERLI
jgi:hypothetical protein